MVITVQRQKSTPNGYGGYTYEWTDLLELEGTLDKLNGDEILANEKLGIVSSHIFITFEMADIRNTDRFIINNKIYQIKDVDNPNNLNRQLEISLEYTGDAYEV